MGEAVPANIGRGSAVWVTVMTMSVVVVVATILKVGDEGDGVYLRPPRMVITAAAGSFEAVGVGCNLLSLIGTIVSEAACRRSLVAKVFGAAVTVMVKGTVS